MLSKPLAIIKLIILVHCRILETTFRRSFVFVFLNRCNSPEIHPEVYQLSRNTNSWKTNGRSKSDCFCNSIREGHVATSMTRIKAITIIWNDNTSEESFIRNSKPQSTKFYYWMFDYTTDQNRKKEQKRINLNSVETLPNPNRNFERQSD